MLLNLLVCLAILALPQPAVLCVKHIEVPDYPPMARAARVQGEVKLHVQLGPDGRVVSAEAVSGPPILADAARANIKTWLFESPGHGELDVSYEFRLERPAVSYLPRSKVILDLPDRVLIVSRLPEVDHAPEPTQ